MLIIITKSKPVLYVIPLYHRDNGKSIGKYIVLNNIFEKRRWKNSKLRQKSYNYEQSIDLYIASL